MSILPPLRDRKFADSSLEGAGFEPSVPREREKERGSTKVAESGSVPGPLAHYRLVGVSGTTAGTPSGGPRVRIRFPPAESLRTIGPSATEQLLIRTSLSLISKT
jgi:hypothetical protein